MKKIEIIDEENSIIEEDDFDTTDFQFFPEDKKFTVSQSIKDDCFYNYQTYEYKISANPIEMQIRLLESSHEPPKEYSVKDGVVLESEIIKRGHVLPDTIQNLKKQVEWSKVDLLGHYEVNLYILSKHPEIISKVDYRKFLRESLERIRSGVSKVEEAVKNDVKELQIHTGEYGKWIWYLEEESDSKEQDEYYELSEEKRSETKYGKKLEYVEKFCKPLFEENSPNYVGVSEYEFKTSNNGLLEHIDNLLNKKEGNSVKDESIKEEKKDVLKWFGYLWTVVTNIITVGVVLGIYGQVYQNFEVIVVSILILIYLSFQSFSMTCGKTTVQTAFGLDTEFKRIRKLLKNEPSRDEVEGMKEARKTIDKAIVKMYINAGFIFIIYLITLAHLFGAL